MSNSSSSSTKLWQAAFGRVELRIIGAGALLLQVDYASGTKDSDILETLALIDEARSQLRALAGLDSNIAKRTGFHAQLVPSGLPFLRQRPLWNEVASLKGRLQYFDVRTLDVVDVVVAKLIRFSGGDQADIEAMVERALIDHEAFLSGFREEADYLLGDARAEDLPKCIANLNRVERDYLGVATTDIELPDCLDR